MPDITNPQAVKFANEKCRVFAEALLTAIQTARSFDTTYAAQDGDTLFPNTSDLIADGSQTDGRPRLAANIVRALRTVAQDIVTWGTQGTPTRETRLRSITDKGEGRF
jgi:hypothetical protein